MLNQMKNFIYLFFLSFLILSCNSNERKAKKFFKRLNAGEIQSSSKYIWPEDHKKLYIFNSIFLDENELINFELEEANSEEINGSEFINLKIKCLNFPTALTKYFDSLGIKKGDYIYDRVLVKKANDTEYLSFNWNWDTSRISSNVKLSTISAEELNVRSGPGSNFDVISTLKKSEKLLIDADYINSDWRKGFIFNQDNEPKTVFFSSKFSDQQDISFFTLGYFADLSIVLLCLIAIVCFIVVYPLLLFGAFRAGSSVGGQAALILFLLIIGSLFFSYQILENVIFELFLINLPL